jgi:RimJ/RimL family protein N-acetyltransferase
MRDRVDGLFRCDGHGRTLSVNQWDGGEPPRFYLGRTTRGNVCRVRADVCERTARELLALVADEPPLAELRSSPLNEEAYVRLLDTGSERPRTDSGPAWCVATDVVPARQPVVIDGANAELLRGGLEDWLPDVPHRQPLMAMLEDGRAVSVCASVRITARTHEAGVETLPAYRGRGHAVNVVAGWAREVRSRGIPLIFYSTGWENTASRQVAAKLGLTVIGADFSIN